ncbi:hypothetical protein JJD41_03055 [Oxynema sp. CENA135]|uniref:hypothetical protein n=1 Tax=Oxynema sp. CENA135 TaxID=984206 RepID=UPI00190A16B3|nr:hypothetical protein [Oxynema sp. CENA135]MBK4728870.1 hypothetical protein [Oxynema sp. CENA135]
MGAFMSDRRIRSAEISGLKGRERQAFLPPIAAVSDPAGYASSSLVFDSRLGDRQTEMRLKKLAGQILQDPMLMQELGDRVWEMMAEELRRDRERRGEYGRRW